jgi:hypothetical protein
MSDSDPAPPKRRVPAREIALYLLIVTSVVVSLGAIAIVYPAARQPQVLLLGIGLCIGFIVMYGADVWRSRD